MAEIKYCMLFQLEALEELDALDKEQVNVSRKIQQLKANIGQLENTRAQVRYFGTFTGSVMNNFWTTVSIYFILHFRY